MEQAPSAPRRPYRLAGEVAQVVTVELQQGESMWAAKGALMSYPDSIDWSLRVPGGAGATVSRMLAGEGITLTYVRAVRGPGHVVLSAATPGKMAVWDLADGPVVTTRGSFVGALGNVTISASLARRPGAAFFGGAGIVLQTVSGEGVVFIHSSGDFLDYRLAAGQTILVSTGNLAAFSKSVDYNIRGVGGCLKILFGGEGIFLTSLSGPGRVLLQTLKRESRVRHAAASQ